MTGIGFVVPKQEDYLQLFMGKSYQAAKCMSSCRGCQCNKSPLHAVTLFSDTFPMFAPTANDYKAVLGSISSQAIFAAGGCPCNCQRCNSCRCDCRGVGKSTSIWEDEQAIWN